MQTTRFCLREFQEEDVVAFERYHQDSRFLHYYGQQEARPGHARGLVQLFQKWASQVPRQNYQLAIIKRGARSTLIGCAGLRRANAPAGTAEIGIELAPEYWGRFGYAVEILAALASFGFPSLGLAMLYGKTSSGNSRISRLIQRVGATAIERDTPKWMSDRGWRQLEWQLTREAWEKSRLASRWSRRVESCGASRVWCGQRAAHQQLYISWRTSEA